MAYTNNIPLTLKSTRYISNTDRSSIIITLLLIKMLFELANSIVKCCYSTCIHISFFKYLLNKVVESKHVFGSRVIFRPLNTCNDIIVIIIEIDRIQDAKNCTKFTNEILDK